MTVRRFFRTAERSFRLFLTCPVRKVERGEVAQGCGYVKIGSLVCKECDYFDGIDEKVIDSVKTGMVFCRAHLFSDGRYRIVE
jgi:hypothetical protein